MSSIISSFIFAERVLFSINKERVEDSFTAAKKLASISGMPVPEAISRLARQKQRFYDSAPAEQLGRKVLENL